jgi:predicted nuclease of restriction endonuclease-like (RecB) superfamily
MSADSSQAPGLLPAPEGYGELLEDLKARVYAAQQRAALAVNAEQIALYWDIGREILGRMDREGWGAKVTVRLSHDLREAFPDMRGFSRTNLDYMRSFAAAWSKEAISQQAVGKLPWGHNLVLLSKLSSADERLWYAEQVIENGWSRNILVNRIGTRAIERWGGALTNFTATLPAPDSDLAVESLKDPYRLDFLGLGKEAHEREIEKAMVAHVEEFLLELGAGFAFVGRQVHLEVGGDDFYLDLLFYHVKLHCYVVVEVKKGKFKPEHLGQLRFYLAAIDGEVKTDHDGPSIGLLLCETKNKVVAEYALRDGSSPLGIAEYRLSEALPADLKTSLPSIEQIERELGREA